MTCDQICPKGTNKIAFSELNPKTASYMLATGEKNIILIKNL